MDDITIENGRIIGDVSDLQTQVVKLKLQTDNSIKKYEFKYGIKLRKPMRYCTMTNEIASKKGSPFEC